MVAIAANDSNQEAINELFTILPTLNLTRVANLTGPYKSDPTNSPFLSTLLNASTVSCFLPVDGAFDQSHTQDASSMQNNFASGCVPGTWTTDIILHGPEYITLSTMSGNYLYFRHDNGTTVQLLDRHPIDVQGTAESNQIVINAISNLITTPVPYSKLPTSVIPDALYGLQQASGMSNDTMAGFTDVTLLAPCDDGVGILKGCALDWGSTATFDDLVIPDTRISSPGNSYTTSSGRQFSTQPSPDGGMKLSMGFVSMITTIPGISMSNGVVLPVSNVTCEAHLVETSMSIVTTTLSNSLTPSQSHKLPSCFNARDRVSAIVLGVLAVLLFVLAVALGILLKRARNQYKQLTTTRVSVLDTESDRERPASRSVVLSPYLLGQGSSLEANPSSPPSSPPMNRSNSMPVIPRNRAGERRVMNPTEASASPRETASLLTGSATSPRGSAMGLRASLSPVLGLLRRRSNLGEPSRPEGSATSPGPPDYAEVMTEENH